MSMHVDYLDALAAHAHIAMHDRTICRLTLALALTSALHRLCGGIQKAPARRQHCRGRARHALHEIPAIRHTLLLYRQSFFKNPSSNALRECGACIKLR